ncbi:MAG: hypothetical protein HKM07_05090 [Chlamydiae bacterium]|nr:hypothetical protein [Chlamydiota bacterium]
MRKTNRKYLIGLLSIFFVVACSLFFLKSTSKKSKSPITNSLKRIALADKTGMLVREKNISIRGVPHPYNPSIVNYGEDKYLMVFRYDVAKEKNVVSKEKNDASKMKLELKRKPKHPKFTPRMGIVELDKNFEQTEKEFVNIDTGSTHSEDARLFVLNGEYYLIFNDRTARIKELDYRAMHLGLLNTDTFTLEYITNLDQQNPFVPVEKNWVPIVHKPSNEEKEKLFLGYSISPRKVLEVPDPTSNQLTHPIYSKVLPYASLKWWKWGNPRGGTPAVEVGGEYLAFFHSFFKDQNHPIKYWYVMGAYTFEGKEPFHITRFSKTPIMFKTLYSAPIDSPFADKTKRVAYPSGFVKGIENGREVFYVSIGEDDSRSKIIVIDKEALYKSMNPVSLESPFQEENAENKKVKQ